MSLNIRPKEPLPEARQAHFQQELPAGLGEQAGFKPSFSVTWCHRELSRRLAGRTQSGFTLVELMVAIAVLAILASIATPSFQGIVAENRATSAANELLATLQFARSAAIAQSRQVTVCPSSSPPTCGTDNTNWHSGWIVLLDGQVLRERTALGPSVTLAGVPNTLVGNPQLTFSSTGTLPGQEITRFDLRVTSGPGASRWICRTPGGSSRVIRGDETC